MNKFALVGKDISHSRSPEMYRKLISPNVHYDLLDYKTAEDIPSALDLLNIYDGINITSPYKKHFLAQVELTPTALEIGAINCLKKKNGKVIGENTDYLAIIDILKEMQKDYGDLEVIILGDGVMANVARIALKNLGLSFKVLSRKQTNDFNQLNLIEHFQSPTALPVVINTCAREFIFNGIIPNRALFWDFNYNFSQHSSTIPGNVHKYVDGLGMLERQALYAVAFWSK
jgi:shikimate dehydrogenase